MSLALPIALLIFGVAASSAIATDDTLLEEYIPYVEAIHPYETFSHTLFEDPDGVFTRKNYGLYLRIHAQHYRKRFSVKEMEQVAGFYQSELGKRFLILHREFDPFGAFLDELKSASRTNDGKGFWTCELHDEVLIADQGRCPICEMKLVRTDLKKNPSNQTNAPTGDTQVGDLEQD